MKNFWIMAAWFFLGATMMSLIWFIFEQGHKQEQTAIEAKTLAFSARCDQLGGTVAKCGEQALCIKRQSILDVQ